MKNIKKLLEKYIKHHYEDENNFVDYLSESSNKPLSKKVKMVTILQKTDFKQNKVDDFIDLIKDKQTFSQYILELIDETGLKDSEIYNRVNMDRRLFSKLRSNKDYQPSKYTVFSLIIALRVNFETAKKMLSKAGYNFSKNHLADIIIMFCLENNIYDIFTVNDLLVSHDQKALCIE